MLYVPSGLTIGTPHFTNAACLCAPFDSCNKCSIPQTTIIRHCKETLFSVRYELNLYLYGANALFSLENS